MTSPSQMAVLQADAPATTRVPGSALLLLAFAISPSKAAGNLLLVGLLLAWLWRLPGEFPRVRADGWGRLLLVYGLYLVFSVGWGAHWYPDGGWGGIGTHADVAFSLWMVPLSILVVGWAVARSGVALEHLRLAFLLGVAVAVVYPVLLGHVSLPTVLHAQVRTGFAMFNPNTLGLYAAMGLLGLVLFPPRSRRSAVPWVGALVLMVVALIASHSRSGWLALALVLPGVLLARRLYGRPSAGRRTFAWTAAALALGAGLFAWHAPEVARSFAPDQPALHALFTWDFSHVPDSSFGQRLHMWRIGVERWLEHPWLGNGPGSAEYFLTRADIESIRTHPHMHNEPLDLLLGIGLLGFALTGAFFVLLARILLRAVRAGTLELNMALFLAGGLGLYLVDALATFLMLRNQGLFFLALFGGMIYSQKLSRAAR